MALNAFLAPNVFVLKKSYLGCGQEELRSVGVLAGVSHGQDACASVGQLEVLICELVAVDGASASAVVVLQTTRKK